jgi:hypothetical protein
MNTIHVEGQPTFRKADKQTMQVLSLLRRDGNVTRLTAQHYGIANLTARIADLRLTHGVNVRCQQRKDAEGRRYGVWSLDPAQSVAVA